MLGSVSSNWNFEFLLSQKRIVDNAILAFKFQQNWLSNISMFLHDWLHQDLYLNTVYVVVGLEVMMLS